MNINEFEKIFWQNYLNFENEFLEIDKVIPYDCINYSVFSYKYMSLLHSICSNMDTIFKRYIKYMDINDIFEIDDIISYEYFISTKYNAFKNSKLICYRYNFNNEIIQPFNKWDSENPPYWWTLNNDIKHNGNKLKGKKEMYKYSNQRNVLMALGGLFILNMYFYKDIVIRTNPNKKLQVPLPQSEIFHLEDWGDYYKYIIANKYFCAYINGKFYINEDD